MRRFQIFLFAAVATTLLPPALTFLATGELGDEEATLISSVVTGTIGSIAAALAKTVKSVRDKGAAAVS